MVAWAMLRETAAVDLVSSLNFFDNLFVISDMAFRIFLGNKTKVV